MQDEEDLVMPPNFRISVPAPILYAEATASDMVPS